MRADLLFAALYYGGAGLLLLGGFAAELSFLVNACCVPLGLEPITQVFTDADDQFPATSILGIILTVLGMHNLRNAVSPSTPGAFVRHGIFLRLIGGFVLLVMVLTQPRMKSGALLFTTLDWLGACWSAACLRRGASGGLPMHGVQAAAKLLPDDALDLGLWARPLSNLWQSLDNQKLAALHVVDLRVRSAICQIFFLLAVASVVVAGVIAAQLEDMQLLHVGILAFAASTLSFLGLTMYDLTANAVGVATALIHNASELLLALCISRNAGVLKATLSNVDIIAVVIIVLGTEILAWCLMLHKLHDAYTWAYFTSLVMHYPTLLLVAVTHLRILVSPEAHLLGSLTRSDDVAVSWLLVFAWCSHIFYEQTTVAASFWKWQGDQRLAVLGYGIQSMLLAYALVLCC